MPSPPDLPPVPAGVLLAAVAATFCAWALTCPDLLTLGDVFVAMALGATAVQHVRGAP